MSDDSINRFIGMNQRRVLVWAAALIGGQAVGGAIMLGFFFALLIPFDRFARPLLLLAFAGLPLPAMFLWVREARAAPRRFALRSSIVCYVYSQLLGLALGLGAIEVGLTSPQDLAGSYGPAVALLLVPIAIWVYFDTRRRMTAKRADAS